MMMSVSTVDDTIPQAHGRTTAARAARRAALKER